MNTIIETARDLAALKYPVWGGALLRMRIAEDASIQTMWTDGKTILYNPDIIQEWGDAATSGVLLHEALHCLLLHFWRRGSRDLVRWSIACDYEVNPLLAAAGVKLPDGALLAPDFEGLLAEEIYERLPEILVYVDIGGMSDGPSEGQEAAWRFEAAKARQAGLLPAGLDRLLGDLLEPRVDWVEILAAHLVDIRQGQFDYTWRKISRRGVSAGLLLPGMYGRGLGTVVAIIDTSGSMDTESLRLALSDIVGLCDSLRAEKLLLISADADVHDVTDITHGLPGDLASLKGGGGTDFRPGIEKAAELGATVILYFSDLEGAFPDASEAPVIWLTEGELTAPVGATVRVRG